jgi:hypothetical protein
MLQRGAAPGYALGVKYGQIGVFRITHDRQTVLACFDDWQVARGV